MQWPEIIEFLGGAAAIAGTVAFLGKKAIEAYLAGRVEAYKSNLEKNNGAYNSYNDRLFQTVRECLYFTHIPMQTF